MFADYVMSLAKLQLLSLPKDVFQPIDGQNGKEKQEDPVRLVKISVSAWLKEKKKRNWLKWTTEEVKAVQLRHLP